MFELSTNRRKKMRRIIIVVAAVVLVAGMAGSAFAANSMLQGSKAVSIGFGDSVLNHVASPTDGVQNNPIVDISGRYFLAKDTAITAGLGFQMNSGDVDGTYLSFNAGIRKYLRVDDFAPFVGGQFSYLTYDAKRKNAAGVTVKYADYSAWEFSGLFGAEYFLAKSFSVEGSIGLALGHGTDDVSHNDTTYIGTRSVGVRANFYF